MKQKILIITIFLFAILGEVRATTHTIQMPGSTQNFCQDTLAMDTFNLIKPLGFANTMWYIDNIPQGFADTLIYVPTNIGSISIRSTWNSNHEYVTLNLFGAPPAHSTLSVTSGGYLSSTNDTAWKCDSTIHINGFTNLNQTYEEWNGPNSFFSSSPSIDVTTFGIYIYERGNTCGTTYDSVLIIELPTQLPTWQDTAFCNTPVNLSIDAGIGWDSYLWNTVAGNHILDITNPGTYQLITSNICASDTSSIYVEHQTYPIPDLSQFNISTAFCADTVLALNPAPGFTFTSYNWSWNNHSSTNSTLNITGDTLTGSNIYTVDVNSGMCYASATDSFAFYPDPIAIELCVVTVDTSGNILVAWNKDETVKSYNIYRLDGVNFIKVANVQYPISQWYDNMVDPGIRAYRYKVTAVSNNGCDDESNLGFFHGSIHITNSPATTGGQNLTITDKYIDESGNYNPDQYYILIDSLNNGNYSIMDSINAVFNSYLVSSPVIGSTYAMGVKLPSGCTTTKVSKGGKSQELSMSISNKTNVMVGITQASKTAINISIYPNPSSGIFYIHSSSKIQNIEVYNALGQSILIKENNLQSINLSNFTKGIYYMKISTEKGNVIRKLIKNE